MSKYRTALPQLNGELFLTDGGIETTLIFHQGFELPHFAAFDLLKNGEGREGLRKYFQPYVEIAKKHGVGFVLESATWRASPDWAEQLGYTPEALRDANRKAIELLREIREAHESDQTKLVISGCVGPRGDGYSPDNLMTEQEAERYHAGQIRTFAGTIADMITAITMTYAEEAIGVARAAIAADMPVVISFTVETDGKLPTGQTLKDAIEQVDAATDNGPAYYMINCAHTTHFDGALAAGEEWTKRIRGLRANASRLSHAELDEAVELDDGNPEEFGTQHRDLRSSFSHVNVIGGCCGTDHRHVENVCRAIAAH
ncbi:MAG: homocysteine S-methyltransferase [Gammaproteobacteria bacterium]|nr:homocysteine S-methyltransferase [Gammaproteobacteria bacterium]